MVTISVVMATRNEELAIRKVLSDIIRFTDDAEIVVVDGSQDNTPNIAEEMGARVIRQRPQGYGIAVKKAILSGQGDIIITMDADGTYPARHIPELVEQIRQGYDLVSASRMNGYPQNMTIMNVLGNKLLAFIAKLLMLRNFQDVTTGMRAYRRELLHRIDWTENTGLSAELLIRPVIKRYKVKEIQIPYDQRMGETKLNPFKGFIEILKSILKYGLWARNL